MKGEMHDETLSTTARRVCAFSCVAVLVCSLLLFAQTASGPAGTVAFRRASDIWIRHLPDGSLIQISQGGGAEYPKWSPSGQWLSFRQNKKFIVAHANGNQQEVRTLEVEGVWSPVRDEVAFADEDGLSVVSFERSDQQKRFVVPNTKSRRIGGVAWSPDGNRFAFLSGQHLWRVNADGTGVQELLSVTGHASLGIRGWSSDGRHIIITVNADSSASIASDGLPLTFVPVDAGRAHIFAQTISLHSDSLSISPDRAEILVSAGCCREAWTNKRVTLVDPATGRFALLTGPKSVAVSPVWSPYGDRIAYVSAPEVEAASIQGTVTMPNGQIAPGGANGIRIRDSVGGGEPARQALAKRRIWVMKADGSEMHQLTADSRYRDENPFWSRDGQYIVFARLDAEDRVSIWSVSLNNGALRKVVDEFDGDNPLNEIVRTFPAAKPVAAWFGYYGHIDWDRDIAWHPE
jgi:Tol biopolymer transport system component